ncbi:hypothetical protein PIB30_086280, partial [Stylosanthes scabra]|nr:hypothetical protein [Stylosanthes scabra]
MDHFAPKPPISLTTTNHFQLHIAPYHQKFSTKQKYQSESIFKFSTARGPNSDEIKAAKKLAQLELESPSPTTPQQIPAMFQSTQIKQQNSKTLQNPSTFIMPSWPSFEINVNRGQGMPPSLNQPRRLPTLSRRVLTQPISLH